MLRRSLPLLLLLVTTVAACAGESSPPPVGRMAPTGRPPAAPGAARPSPPAGQPGAPPAGHPAIPAGHPAMPPAAGAATPLIEGTLDASPALAAKVKAGDVIFLTARPLDAAGAPGKTVVAERLEVVTLPMAFALTSAHRMSETPLVGTVLVTARLDRDSEAMTREPGDLEGVVRTELPAKGLKITLDTEVKP